MRKSRKLLLLLVFASTSLCLNGMRRVIKMDEPGVVVQGRNDSKKRFLERQISKDLVKKLESEISRLGYKMFVEDKDLVKRFVWLADVDKLFQEFLKFLKFEHTEVESIFVSESVINPIGDKLSRQIGVPGEIGRMVSLLSFFLDEKRAHLAGPKVEDWRELFNFYIRPIVVKVDEFHRWLTRPVPKKVIKMEIAPPVKREKAPPAPPVVKRKIEMEIGPQPVPEVRRRKVPPTPPVVKRKIEMEVEEEPRPEAVEIEELKRQLEEKDAEIERLKEQLEQVGLEPEEEEEEFVPPPPPEPLEIKVPKLKPVVEEELGEFVFKPVTPETPEEEKKRLEKKLAPWGTKYVLRKMFYSRILKAMKESNEVKQDLVDEIIKFLEKDFIRIKKEHSKLDPVAEMKVKFFVGRLKRVGFDALLEILGIEEEEEEW